MRRAFDAGREIVLWHEERPAVLDDLMKLPVLGICTDLPDLMRPPVVKEKAVGRQG
jgi:glycerophosphoryl diester phosphodiesterase